MDSEARIAGWTIFGVLCAFKFVMVAVIFAMMPSSGAAMLLLVFHWFWLLPLVVVGLGALLGWLRLARVRARREQLRRAEFLLD